MEFLENLKVIKEEARKVEDFNIFSALYKEHDERRLHSRFIAYLLSPEAAHGEGDKFLKLFFEKALGLGFDGFEECDVLPKPAGEGEKEEHENIDILIINSNTKKAIIVENKIYAADSNHEEVPQLVGYFGTIKNELKLNDDEAKKSIHLVYLTLTGKHPSLLENFDTHLYNLPKLIDYPSEIVRWLDACISAAENDFLRECIKQYKTLVTKLTSDVKRAVKLQKLIGNNIEQAWREQGVIREMYDFPHVKWHTIADFWNELSDSLEKTGLHVDKRMSVDEITKVAHNNQRGSFGIVFKTPTGEEWYVMNDMANGLTYGRPSDNPQKNETWFPIGGVGEIKFAKFDNKETFELINKECREQLIKQLVEQLKKKI